MSTQQSEALRLADRLDTYATGDSHQQDIEQAAAELRRLHEENKALRKRLAQPEQELVDLSYQPDWKEEYQKAVDLHCLTLDELREKNVEIKRLKAMIESQDMVLVRSAARIVDLQTHIENFDGGDR